MATPCPGNPPAPAGYAIWKGSVPTPLTQWAMDLRDHVNGFPYGNVWTTSYGGAQVAARKDHHTWTYKNGTLVSGICIPGITLYREIIGAQAGEIGGGDPASVSPDPTLAVYGADDVPAPAAPASSTGLIVVGAVAAVLGVTAIALAVRAARLRAAATPRPPRTPPAPPRP